MNAGAAGCSELASQWRLGIVFCDEKEANKGGRREVYFFHAGVRPSCGCDFFAVAAARCIPIVQEKLQEAL
jgi:hypothetical protein